MSDDLVKQSIVELLDIVRCRCHPAYRDRGMQDPDCECDSADAVKVVADRIEELKAKLASVTAAYRIEAMRREDYSHEAFDQHIAELKGETNA